MGTPLLHLLVNSFPPPLPASAALAAGKSDGRVLASVKPVIPPLSASAELVVALLHGLVG